MIAAPNPRRLTLGALTAAVCCLALLGLPSVAAAVTKTATDGALTAQMSYTNTSSGTKNLRVEIIRNGVVLLDQAPGPTCKFCSPLPDAFGNRSPVHAVQLDASPEPEAVFDLYTGGAHCCSYSLIYRYDPATNTYVGTQMDWFDPGYRFIDPENDGVLEFKTLDDHFAYKYAAYAFSQYPPQIWRYESGQMVDVTRQYPAIVGHAAAAEKGKYQRRRGGGDVRAILAAYTADECLLGKCSTGFGLVAKARQRGELSRPGSPGGKYVHSLRAFLKRLGYLAAP